MAFLNHSILPLDFKLHEGKDLYLFIFKLVLFYFNILFISFCLCWVFIAACRLSLLVVSWGYSLVATLSLLVAVASLAAQALGLRLSSCSTQHLVASWHVGSSQTRDQTCGPCIGRWILNHWTSREVPGVLSLPWPCP